MGISERLQNLAVLEQLERVTIRAEIVREQRRELAAVGAEALHPVTILLAPGRWTPALASSLDPKRLHLDRAIRPASLRRELPRPAQGERNRSLLESDPG